MIYTDDDLIPISYISQYEYCKRRAGLLFLEQQWTENIHTTEGTIIHERAHSGLRESRSGFLVLRAINLISYKYGLVGKSDCVELTKDEKGYTLPWIDGKWLIYPVEYKHGDVRDEPEYELQVCAQAMCLEEMCNCQIEHGYLYYEGANRRIKVIFDDEKRARVQEIVTELHNMQKSTITPSAIKCRRCNGCSMYDICLPDKLKSPTSYIQKLMKEASEE